MSPSLSKSPCAGAAPSVSSKAAMISSSITGGSMEGNSKSAFSAQKKNQIMGRSWIFFLLTFSRPLRTIGTIDVWRRFFLGFFVENDKICNFQAKTLGMWNIPPPNLQGTQLRPRHCEFPENQRRHFPKTTNFPVSKSFFPISEVSRLLSSLSSHHIWLVRWLQPIFSSGKKYLKPTTSWEIFCRTSFGMYVNDYNLEPKTCDFESSLYHIYDPKIHFAQVI